jgi:hypothetical protein
VTMRLLGSCRSRHGENHMVLSLVLSLCVSACSEPTEPRTSSLGSAPGGPVAAPPVPTDSACQSLTITLVGSNNLTLAFPERSSCTSGFVLIPGGTATRSGGAKRTVNIPIRLLNQTGYPVQMPATLVLNPASRVVLAPLDQPISKIVPQNQDSIRSGPGEWVWLVGSSGTIQLSDSTPARTVSIRLESSVTSAAVTFTSEATMLTGAGWPLLTTAFPPVDATKMIQRPATSISMFRTAAALRFVDGISDAAKQSFFSQNGLTVLGVTVSDLFFVSFADPGTSIAAFDSILNVLRSKPEILRVLPVYASGFEPRDASRFPVDSMKRSDWFSQSASLWAMRAIRAPLAWGCETGAYGSLPVTVGLVEWSHNAAHPEFAASSPRLWIVPDSKFPATIVPVNTPKRDSAYRHSAATGGLLTASGDDARGMAGVSWKTKLIQYSLRSPAGRPLLPSGLFEFIFEVRRAPPRILSVSIDAVADSSMDSTSRADLIQEYRKDLGDLLTVAPNLLIVLAAGNEQVRTTVASYITRRDAGIMRSALLLLRLESQYQNRIIVVAGSKPGNNFWDVSPYNSLEGSNSFNDATDLAAPAQDVGTIDSVRTNMPVGFYMASGTSLATPIVAGGAALLLAMDPTLTPAQVKDYLIRGAQLPRNDSTTGAAVVPSAVAGVPNAAVFQLDLYGALQLLSKERPNTPICGYPLSGGYNGQVYYWKNGPESLPTDSVAMPGNQGYAPISVAQGGRRYSTDGFGGVQVVSYTGALIHFISGLRQRYYLERDTVDVAYGYHFTRYRPGSPPVSIYQVTYPDGSPVTTGPGWFTFSPDGRFLTFTGGQDLGSGAVSGLYVERFSDFGTELIHACAVGDSCYTATSALWSHDARRLLATAHAYSNNYDSRILSFAVTVGAEAGAFSSPTFFSTPSGHSVSPVAFTGDDAVFYGLEATWTPFMFYLVKRPAGALGTVVEQTDLGVDSPIIQRLIGNIRAHP